MSRQVAVAGPVGARQGCKQSHACWVRSPLVHPPYLRLPSTSPIMQASAELHGTLGFPDHFLA